MESRTSVALAQDPAIAEELQRNHQGLSEVDLRFREMAASNANLRSRRYFAGFGFDELETMFWVGRLQSWPMFCGTELLAQLTRAAEGLSRLIRAVPKVIYDDDPVRIGEVFGVDPVLVEVLLEPPSPIATELARADLVLGSNGFRCLEMNFGGALGGLETPYRRRMFESVPEIRDFMAEEGIGWAETDALRRTFHEFLDQALRLGLGREGSLNLAMVGTDDIFQETFDAMMEGAYREVLRSRGLPFSGRFFWTQAYHLREEGDALWLGSDRIHGVLEMSALGVHPALFPLACAGELVLFGGPVLRLLSSKAILADLSENQESTLFTEEERAILRDHLPWTRRVGEREVHFRGRDWYLPDLLASHRDSLVLKAAHSLGGQDVAVGPTLSEEEWRAAVERALGPNSWIVQEYEPSLRFLFQVGEGCEPHDAIWGPFVFGGRYSGSFVRVQPSRVAGPLNVSLGGSSTSVVEV